MHIVELALVNQMAARDAGSVGEGAKPDLFFSFSTAEPTRIVLSTFIWIVFHNEYNLRFTPSALTSGQSQLQEIEKQISGSTFGIVCWDGLRPNVIHEYGFMRGLEKPVILLKKEDATVDVRLFLQTSAPQLENPALEINIHLSNLKDINYAIWYPEDPQKSTGAIWDEYNKLKKLFPGANLTDVREPNLW
jgi:hypothetical protein